MIVLWLIICWRSPFIVAAFNVATSAAGKQYASLSSPKHATFQSALLLVLCFSNSPFDFPRHFSSTRHGKSDNVAFVSFPPQNAIFVRCASVCHGPWHQYHRHPPYMWASANLIITTDIVWNSIRNGLNTSVSVYHAKHIGTWSVQRTLTARINKHWAILLIKIHSMVE